MRKLIVALLMCLMCLGLQAQVISTSSRRLPSPTMQRPQMSTAMPLKSRFHIRTAEPRTVNPQTPKPVIEREYEPNYHTTQHYIAAGFYIQDIGAREETGPGVAYGFMRNFAGSFHKAFAAYWGAELAANYNLDEESFTFRGMPQVGLVVGKPTLRFDIRAQVGYLYCTDYRVEYYDSGYNTYHEEGGQLWAGLGAGLSFNKFMIGARGLLTPFDDYVAFTIMLGLRL